MKRSIGTLLAFIAVAAGLIAIFKIVVDSEVAVGFVTISFGILAIIWTYSARASLSEGSSLRKHITNFLFCLVFILLFSVWHTVSKVFRWRETVNELMLYPGYVFLILAFLIFVMTSYHVLAMGKEFGFRSQAKEIKRVIEKKKEGLRRKKIKAQKMSP